MQVVLLYRSDKEPITNLILNNENLLTFESPSISIETLLKEVDIFDVIENGVPLIQWKYSDSRLITNMENYRKLS